MTLTAAAQQAFDAYLHARDRLSIEEAAVGAWTEVDTAMIYLREALAHTGDGVKITGPALRTLAKMFPDGTDVVAGREPGYIHAQGLAGQGDPDTNEYGVCIGHQALPGTDRAGSLGISRTSYFNLPQRPSDA